MVGREDDLRFLRDAFAEAGEGRPQGVVIGGEAGMGKTRLLTEFERDLEPTSAVVLTATCVDHGPIGLPYAPIRTLVRQLASAVGAQTLIDAAGPGRAALASLAPELGDGSAEGVEPLSETLPFLLRTFSVERPLVLIVDDLQWADPATVSLLSSILRTIRTGRVLAVLSFRTDDPGNGNGLRSALAELGQSRVVTRRDLRRLTVTEVGGLIRALTGRTPSPAERSRIGRRSEGVPFFVEELIGIDETLPDSFRDVLLARYRRLGPDSQEFARMVAVGGTQVDQEIIAAISGATFDAAAAHAVAEGALTATEDGYAFRHDLVRECIYAETLPAERRRLHLSYADALRAADGDASVMSYHLFAAHDLPRALAAAVGAFDEARRTAAYATAVELGVKALDVWSKVPRAEELASRSRFELLEQTTNAAHDAGDTSRALVLVDLALQACPPGANIARAELLRTKSFLSLEAGIPGGVQCLRDALEAIADEPDARRLKSLILKSLGVRMYLGGDPAGSIPISEEAIAVAHAAGAGDVESMAMVSVGVAELELGRVEAGLEWVAAARPLAADGHSLFVYGSNVSDALVGLGRFAEAIDVTEYPIRRAQELGMERIDGLLIRSNQADALFGLGRWTHGLEQVNRVLEIGPTECLRANAHRRRIWHALWSDDLEAAGEIERENHEVIEAFAVGDLQDAIPTAHALGELALFRGDLDEAWERVSLLWSPRHIGAAGHDLPLLSLGARVLGAMRRQGTPWPEDAVESLTAVFDALPSWPNTPRWRAFFDAELAHDGHGTSVDAWQAAADALDSDQVPAHLAPYGLMRLGMAQLDAGDRGSAAVSLTASAERAERIGAAWIADRARALVSKAGLSGSRRDHEGDLTARERQVLALIAEGLSNREIGIRLFISTKTASTHVSAILRKLGAATRTEAAVLSERMPA